MLTDYSLCTGCGACAAKCPLNCIIMKSDQEGFRYPVIDSVRCISCKKCEAVCSVLNTPPAQVVRQAYGVKHKDDCLRNTSSSGGVFPALAAFVLEKGGAVCGAAYTEDFSVEHQIIESISDIRKLQGAKYAQSYTEHLFPVIRRILESDRWLLFVGTPCQTTGLHAYLGKDHDKLILVDMICHGVPSPCVWKKYLGYRIEKDTNNSNILHINQRDKASGWSRYRYSLKIDYADGKTYCSPQSEDPYMRGFVNNLFLRPSCAQCQFKGVHRCADLTLGDYWGVWEQYPEFDDNKGVSLVLINTQKGAYLWNLITNNLNIVPVDSDEALAKNPSALYSSEPHPKRNEFFARVETADFEKLVSELFFGKAERRYSIRNLLRKIIKH